MTEAPEGEAPEGEAPAPPPEPRLRPGLRPGLWLVAVLVVALLGVVAYVLARPTEHDAAPDPGNSPVHATEQSFCTAYARLAAVDDGRSVHDWANGLAKIGTPDGVPDDARAGFELVLARAAAVDEDASASKLARKQGHLTPAEKQDVDAFTEYATTTCAREIEKAVQDAAAS